MNIERGRWFARFSRRCLKKGKLELTLVKIRFKQNYTLRNT